MVKVGGRYGVSVIVSFNPLVLPISDVSKKYSLWKKSQVPFLIHKYFDLPKKNGEWDNST